jgi:hypothetical protein
LAANVSTQKLAEIARAVDRELESRRALNAGLQQLVGFAGALLALAFALGAHISRHELGCSGKVLVTVSFLGTLISLLMILIVALSGLRPQPRTTLNPETFRFYADQGTSDAEVRRDIYGTEVDLLEELQSGNDLRAKRHRLALYLLPLPLGLAAVAAITLFFNS